VRGFRTDFCASSHYWYLFVVVRFQSELPVDLICEYFIVDDVGAFVFVLCKCCVIQELVTDDVVSRYCVQWRSRTFGRSGRWSNLPPFRLRFRKLESSLFKV